MSVYATSNGTACGRDGSPCPTGEHGFCPGCRGEVPVQSPIAYHDAGCPAVEHCSGCATEGISRGHRVDCPCAYDDHRVSAAVMAKVHAEAEAEYVAWGMEALTTAAQSGSCVPREELRDAVHAAAMHSRPTGRDLLRLLDRVGTIRIQLFDHEYRVRNAPAGTGYRVTLATTDTRMTEADFRAKAPQQLGGIEILEITRFDSGSFDRGTYALAAALTRTNGFFSTHTLIYQDERDSWLLSTGHYDILTRAEAATDARNRALV